MSRWILGAVLSAAFGLFTVGGAGANMPDDLVSDQEASTVIGGGGCNCIEGDNCGSGAGCSGWGLDFQGSCLAKAEFLFNNHVCGSCKDAWAEDTSGCDE